MSIVLSFIQTAPFISCERRENERDQEEGEEEISHTYEERKMHDIPGVPKVSWG
jgi:hypothetical protein